MNRFKLWQKVVLGIGLAALVAIPLALAAGPHLRGHLMKHMIAARIEAAEDAIDATPAQRQVIDAAKDRILATFEAKAKEHEGQRGQWIALLTADTLDTQKLYAEVDRKAAEAQAMAREIVPELEKIHAALTLAQRQKLAERAKSMHERRFGPEGD